MPLPPLVVERNVEVKCSGTLDDAMIGLVEHVMNRECRSRISLLQRSNRDDKTTAKSLVKLMEDELDYSMPESDAYIIVQQFRQRQGFDLKSFVSAFDAYYDYHYKAHKLP